MRSTVYGFRCILAASIATLVSFTPSRARAATLSWDVGPDDGGTLTDGTGDWSDGLGNWNTGTANTNWDNTAAPANNAIFGAGGTAGIVNLLTPITVGDITFNTVTDSYLLTGATLTLSSIAPTITVNDDAARIDAGIFSTTGLIKAGTGKLTLGAAGFGALDITGGITVNAGALEFNGTGGFNQSPFVTEQTITANNGATILISTPHALGGDNNFAANKVVLNGGTLTLDREQYFGADGVQMTGATVNGTNEIRSAPGAAWTVNAAGTTSTIASRVNLVSDLTLDVADGTAATDLLISGNITNAGSLTKLGAGSMTISGANTFSGATNVSVGTLVAGSVNALGRGDLIVEGTLDLGGFSQSVSGLSGAGTITSNLDGVATLTVGNGNMLGNFAGAIQDGGVGKIVSLTKVGSEELILSGATNYSGNTTVSGGKLTVPAGNISGSANITIAPTASLVVTSGLTRGAGQTLTAGHALSPDPAKVDVSGNVIVSGGTINVGQSGAKTLTFENDLAVSGGSTINYDFATAVTAGADVNDIVDVKGTLNLSGPVSVGISSLNGPLSTASPYTLMTAATFNNTATLSAKDAANYRQTFNFSSTPTAVQMTVSGSAANLTWTGATSGVWSVNNATNWSGAADQKFFQLDTVTFDDTSSINTVSVEGTVNPATVTINNTTTAYTLAGPGSIAGGALTKSGSGVATVNLPLSIGGPVTVNAGTLTLLGLSNLSGTITVNAGTLSTASPLGAGGALTLGSGTTYQYTGSTASLDRALTLSAAGASTIDVATAGTILTLGSTSSGPGSLTKTGAGTLRIPSTQGFGGSVNVDGGTLEFTTALFSGNPFSSGRTLTVKSGGTLLLSNFHSLGGDNGSAPNGIVLNGGTLTVNFEQYIGAAGLTMTAGTVNGTSEIRSIDSGITIKVNPAAASSTIASRIWARGNVTFDVADGAAADDLVVDGAITPGLATGGIIKDGPGRAVLNGANTYTGVTIVKKGILALGATSSIVGERIEVTDAAQLDVSAVTGGLVLNGGQTLTAGHSGVAFNDVVGSVNSGFGSSINIGGSSVIRTLTISGDLNLGGDNTVSYDLSNNVASGNDAITVGGALNLSGTTMIAFNATNGSLATGTYTLFTAGSVNGTGANLALVGGSNTRQTFTFGTTATAVTLGVTGSAANLTWVGDGTANAWDVVGASNWTGAPDQKFFNLDSVTFNDSGSAAPVVNIAAAVNPGSITFDNSTKNYILSGAGTISTDGVVTKSGSGTVAIEVPATFNNHVVINGGTFSTNSVIGTGTIPGATLTIGSGTYRYDGSTASVSRPLVLNAANSAIGVGFASEVLTIAGGSSGTGGLAKEGPGTLAFQSSGTAKQNFSGPIVVNEGTLEFRGGFFAGNPFAAGKTITVNAGATVLLTNVHSLGGSNSGMANSIVLNGGTLTVNAEQYIGANGLTMTAGAINGGSEIRTIDAGTTITVNASPNSSMISSAIAIRGNLTLNVADGGASDDLVIDGNIANMSGTSGGLVKSGPGRVVFNGQGTYVGATNINAGMLAIGETGSITSSLINVASGAQLDVSTAFGFAINAGQTLRVGRAGTPATDVNGNLTTNSGGTINVGGSAVVRTATFGGNLGLGDGSTVAFDLSTAATPGGGINDLVNVLGTLDVSAGVTNIALNATDGSLAAGPYTLFTASSFNGTAANLQVAGGASSYRQAFTFNTTTVPNTVQMSVSGSTANLTWVGGAGSNAWDVNNTTNWSGMADQKFFQFDSVTFDDTSAPGNNAVTLTAALRPGAVVVNSSTNNFAFSGAGLITGGGSLTKSGTSMLTLSTANSYTGLTTISGGIVKLGNATALGTGDKGTIVESGAALDFNGVNVTGESMTISGTGIGGAGVLINTNATGVGLISAPLILAGDATIGAGNRINVSGAGSAITSNGNNYTLTKKGTGLMSVFSGVQVSLQNIVVDAGTLEFQSSDTLVDNTIPGNITVNNGATLGIRFFGGTPTILKPIVLNAGATFGTTRTGPGSNTIGANVTLNGTSTIQAGLAGNAADPLILTGVIAGDGGFSKTGGSDLTLAGINTYTGSTTVTSGKLIATGSISGSSQTTVETGATLAGNGTIGKLTINGGGTLAPGLSPGVLNTGDLLLAAVNSHLSLEINGSTAGSLYDQLNVTGLVSLNGDIQLTLGTFDPVDFVDKFFIVLNDGTDTVTGTFAGLGEGATFLQGNQNWQVFYGADSASGNTSGGNDVLLVAVPEPGSCSLIALAGLACLTTRRRRVGGARLAR